MSIDGKPFADKVRDRSARVGILGLGYVGLPLVLEFGKYFQVAGFDTDPKKVEALNRGESYIKHIPAPEIAALAKSGKFRAYDDFSELQHVDAAIICVPTPLNEFREPDLTYVEATARSIAKYLQRGQLVVLESTTYPGTTDEMVQPILEASGMKCDPSGTPCDYLLAFSPERVDPGNKNYGIRNVPKVVGGINPASRDAACALYASIVDKVVPVSTTRAAEMTKLLENIYRCVNIALVNELKVLSERMGIDIWEVIDAASSKPYGFTPFQPGPGLGGHCIPIDPYYLSWKAREFEFQTRFIELAGEVNSNMPYHVVHNVTQALNARRKSVNGSRVLVLGVAYKKDIDDLRESPSLRIMELLQELGAEVSYNDPYFERLHKMRKHDFSALHSSPIDAASLAKYDCVLIATDHSAYDYESIVRNSAVVVDTRNATRKVWAAHPDLKSKIVLS
jgi:UDP-N-acetyl-D-glucosamine dehydrogenase